MEVTWEYAVESASHGFNGTLFITRRCGRENLTPLFDAKRGPSDWLYPQLLQDGLSMYKITHNETYLEYARDAARSIEQNMLNDRGIICKYSYRTGVSKTDPTDLNYYILPAIAELAIYDPSFRPLAEEVAYGVIHYGLSKNDIPYGSIYPGGSVAETISGLPSNGGDRGTISIAVIGLLRTYQATENQAFLNKSRDILLSIWNNKRTRYDLVPTSFDSVSLQTTSNDTQLYATGELLRAYIYYYYLTHDPQFKRIIGDYSSAAYSSYWNRAGGRFGYFVYRVDVDTGRPSVPLLETNWHKLDMSLIYAGEIAGRDYTPRVYRDMNTFWLGRGMSYTNHLFRHGTKTDGSSARNAQSLVFASFRTTNYVMLRMLNLGAFRPSDDLWNEKVWRHVDAVRVHHYHRYGYHTDVDVDTLQPDEKYFGLAVISACDEFSSLVTLIFQTTPNVKMGWEIFPEGDYSEEPFSTAYLNDVAFMRDVFMDYSHREIAFRKVTSNGMGLIHCTQSLSEVRLDGKVYRDWQGDTVRLPDGSHECTLIFKGGSYVAPTYP
ncbi:MAG TPA: hypothetical protein VN455_05910 [Methanotrichaceae archaeon]|nr:hypothetical protein [Methanotrichaceae archaeon]